MPAAVASLFSDVALEQVVSSLSRLPDPDLVLAAQGLGRHELRKLETDDEISAALETRREAVISTSWRLEPYESPDAEWLWEVLEPHMEPLLRGAWSAVPYGFSVVEAIYAKGARVTLARVSEKPLEWFEPRRDGTLWYTPSLGLGSGVPVEVDTRAKFLLTRRNPTYRNPYGEALLSRCYWSWFFRHNGWRFWMRFVERFADPLLLGRTVSPGEFITAMQQQGFEAVVGVGTEEEVRAVTTGLAGEFEKVEMALGRRIQKLILGQTLTSEIGDKGSYAAAQVHNEVREDKRRADIRLVTTTVQRLCDALWTINALPGDAPTFVMADDTGLETPRAERDAKLVPALTASGLRLTPEYYLDNFDYEPEHLGEVPVTAPALAPMLSAPGPGVRLAAPRPQRFTQDQALVEALADAALEAAGSPVPAAAIRAAILASDSPEDLYERLAALYGSEDVDGFQELMARSLFAADVLGFTTAEKRVGGS